LAFKAFALNSPPTFDYIIVGQGLAGSCLALQLIKQRKRILVIDIYTENTATQVAAGLFNPITGRNMLKTWKADELFPYLHSFYTEAEHLTGEKFYHPMPLYRPFVSVEEQNEWMGKSINPELGGYIEKIHTSPIDPQYVKNNFGGLSLKQCGYLDTVKFTRAVRHYIQDHGQVISDSFVEEALMFQADSIVYKDYRATNIVFCQGVDALKGKLFSWVPIRPLKGETLTLKTQTEVSVIYNRGVYVVPGHWRVGATYQKNDTTPAVTNAARTELEDKLTELVCFPYEITDQTWGMRPTTPDRKPILGVHPEHARVSIFNGLGTKGVSLAPYFSGVLVARLENNVPINKEVDINRYKHYNYGGNFLK
jgi:glycine oxidase